MTPERELREAGNHVLLGERPEDEKEVDQIWGAMKNMLDFSADAPRTHALTSAVPATPFSPIAPDRSFLGPAGRVAGNVSEGGGGGGALRGGGAIGLGAGEDGEGISAEGASQLAGGRLRSSAGEGHGVPPPRVPPPLDPRHLTSKLKNCKDVRELCALAAQVADFNRIHCVVFLRATHRLCRHAQRMTPDTRSVVDAVLLRAKDVAGDFERAEVRDMLSAVDQLGLTPPRDVLDAIVRRALEVARGLPAERSSTVWAEHVLEVCRNLRVDHEAEVVRTLRDFLARHAPVGDRRGASGEDGRAWGGEGARGGGGGGSRGDEQRRGGDAAWGSDVGLAGWGQGGWGGMQQGEVPPPAAPPLDPRELTAYLQNCTDVGQLCALAQRVQDFDRMHCCVALRTTQRLCQGAGGMTEETRRVVEAVLDRTSALPPQLDPAAVMNTLGVAHQLGVAPRRDFLDAVLWRALEFARQLPSDGSSTAWAAQMTVDCWHLGVGPESALVRTLGEHAGYVARQAPAGGPAVDPRMPDPRMSHVASPQQVSAWEGRALRDGRGSSGEDGGAWGGEGAMWGGGEQTRGRDAARGGNVGDGGRHGGVASLPSALPPLDPRPLTSFLKKCTDVRELCELTQRVGEFDKIHCVVALHAASRLCRGAAGMNDATRIAVEGILGRTREVARDLNRNGVRDALIIPPQLGVAIRRDVLDAVLGRALELAGELPADGSASVWAAQVLAECWNLGVAPESELVRTLSIHAALHAPAGDRRGSAGEDGRARGGEGARGGGGGGGGGGEQMQRREDARGSDAGDAGRGQALWQGEAPLPVLATALDPRELTAYLQNCTGVGQLLEITQRVGEFNVVHCGVALRTTQRLCQCAAGMNDGTMRAVEAVLGRTTEVARDLDPEAVVDALSIPLQLGVAPRREVLDAVLRRALELAIDLSRLQHADGAGTAWAVQVLALCWKLGVGAESELVRTLSAYVARHETASGSGVDPRITHAGSNPHVSAWEGQALRDGRGVLHFSGEDGGARGGDGARGGGDRGGDGQQRGRDDARGGDVGGAGRHGVSPRPRREMQPLDPRHLTVNLKKCSDVRDLCQLADRAQEFDKIHCVVALRTTLRLCQGAAGMTDATRRVVEAVLDTIKNVARDLDSEAVLDALSIPLQLGVAPRRE
ncbi:hypothetical protein T484DRAFT_1905982, partial [Baffinella frigidus]